MKRHRTNKSVLKLALEALLKKHKALEEFERLVVSEHKIGKHTTVDEYLNNTEAYEWIIKAFDYRKVSFRQFDWVHINVEWRKLFHEGQPFSKFLN